MCGAEGMSSDESDCDTSTGKRFFRVKNPKWRAKAADNCMALIDAHLDETTGNRGAESRVRLRGHKTRKPSERKAPLKKPEEFYDGEWLKGPGVEPEDARNSFTKRPFKWPKVHRVTQIRADVYRTDENR